MIGKCQNCHEKDCELEEIEIDGIKKNWCEDCISGWNLEKQSPTMLQEGHSEAEPSNTSTLDKD